MNGMKTPDSDTLLFFDGHRDALELYLALEELLYGSFPAVGKRVMKTQISFFNRNVFACVSFARVKRGAELPQGWLTLTLGLPAPLDSPRVAVKTEPYPGRWTHHFVISRREELDAELLRWIGEAYAFADAKRACGRPNGAKPAEVQYGQRSELASWMDLVREVRGNFPGLESEEALAEHEDTVVRFMSQNRALCVKDREQVVGVLLFSRKHNMICCMAVKPGYRRRGIASMLMKQALRELDPNRDVVVSTFREGDEAGVAARAFYRTFGFTEGELTEEFGYPNQVFTLHR